MARLAIFTSTLHRPDCLSSLLNNILCQKYTDVKVYLGTQDVSDLECFAVRHAMRALREKGIDIEVVYVPPQRGKFVATKNEVLRVINEPYAFHTDDDNVFEHDYLDALVSVLDARSDIDCVSGTRVPTLEVSFDREWAEPLDENKKYKFCWLDEQRILHWATRLQRVNYPRERKIVKVEALTDPFMFRMDAWKDPFDKQFDEGEFYLNETEWSYREFRCAFTPLVRMYHSQPLEALSLGRAKHFDSINRAAYYYAKKHFGLDIAGVEWRPKFWHDLELTESMSVAIQAADGPGYLSPQDYDGAVVAIADALNVAEDFCTKLFGRRGNTKVTFGPEIMRNMAFVKVQNPGGSIEKDILLKFHNGRWVIRGVGKAQYWGQVRFCQPSKWAASSPESLHATSSLLNIFP